MPALPPDPADPNPTPENKLVRCPVCLYLMAVPLAADDNTELQCVSCKRPFRLRNALASNAMTRHGDVAAKKSPLPVRDTRTSEKLAVEVERAEYLPASIAGFAVLGALFVGVTYYVSARTDGPEFLAYYFAVFAATLLGAVVVRSVWHDVFAVSMVGMLLFEIVGLERIVLGMQQGMQKFEYLVIGMILGGICYFIRFGKQSSAAASAGSCGIFIYGGCGSGGVSSCSGGSGCSSGSSCGSSGGCGGCGSSG